MAGLFDSIFGDPSGQAMYALGSGLLGVRRGGEGRALQMAMQAYNEAQQEQRRNKLTDSQLALHDMQVKAMQQKIADDEAMRGIFKNPSNYMAPAQPAVPWGSGMTGGLDSQDINPGTPAQPPRIDQQRLIAAMASSGNPALVQKAIEMSVKDDTPIPVKEGEVLLDRNSRKPIFSNPKVHDPASVIQEFNLAVQQGYKGTITDWLIAQKRAGAQTTQIGIQNYQPFGQEIQKDAAKALSARFEQLQDAPTQVQNIAKAKELVAGASPFVGSGAEKKLEVVKFFNNNFGTNISPDAVRDAETLRTTLFMQIMDNLKKMDAQPSQMQQVMMRDALGNLNTDPGAIGTVLDVMESALRSKVSEHNKRVQGFTSRPGMAGVLPYEMTIALPESSQSGTLVYNPKTGKLERK